MKIVRRIIEQEIIDKMLLTIGVLSIDALVLTVCRTGWLRIGSVIKDDNNVEYKVTSFAFNQSLTVDKLGFVGNVHISKPLLIDATINQGQVEYESLSHLTSEKTPIIYLQDGSVIDTKSNRNSTEANISGVIFFIDWYNDSWSNLKINDYVLEPINELSEHFKNTTEDNFTFFRGVESYLKAERKRFGREEQNGLVSHYFGDSLTAIECRFSINANRSTKSCCKYIDNNIPITCADGTATNSDTSYSLTVPSGTDVPIPDTTLNFNLDFETATATFATLSNQTINITLV